ncbi:ABC transporter ATP-binding protein [Streptococcus pneumoniae]|nr:ABC transporter ATP-binding protein [Streptococcus pneumoniae]
MIELKNISKKFGSRQLFSDTNLHFEGGKIYALIGTSGCGKTTLLNMIGRLEPYDKGQIIYDGTSLKDIKPSVFFRDYLGYLFQDFGLIESQTVKENLNLGLVGKKLKEKEKISLMKQALNRVNLSYLDLKQPIFELSGGEAQRVALAKIILNPNHSYLSQLDVTYKTPDLMSHFLPPHEVSFTFCCSSIVFPR